MACHVVDIGPPAHDDERAALAFLVQGLPPEAVVFTNPWLIEPSGAVYELDAVVVMPHAIYVVEIKGWSGHLHGDTRDWYLPEPRRSPLQLAHKTAQVLQTLLARTSHDAGRAWVQEIVFLPAAASFTSPVDAVRKRVALRGEIHAVLQDAGRIRELAHRRPTEALSHEVLDTLTRLLRGAPRQPPLTAVAGFRVIDRFDANERYREVLGEDTTGTRRVLRIYRIPWDATEAEREQLRKRATWEAAILRSFDRAPDDVGLPRVDPPVETDVGLVVPIEHFDGETLPAWLAGPGRDLPLRDRVALWARVAHTLAWTHRAGVIHRQLRPELVLVKGELDPRDPRTPAFRVTGFDMAKRQGANTTVAWSDTALRRLEGAAPEVVQMVSDAVPASDQFSLGLVLALLVLRRPLVESTLPLVERRHRMPHLRDVDPDVPQRLDDVVARMLERKPADRFPSVEEAVRHALAAVGPEAPEVRRGLAPGARVGSDLVVEGPLGAGGLSEVYQVKHQLLGERYALKVARPTEVAERALMCEYHALRAIQHPAIVRVHDLSRVVEDRITLRLDLVPGATLAHVVREGRLAPDDLAARRRLGEDLLGALDEMERVGLVHNDLKPDNLMVTPQGRLVLIDFSLARSPAVEAKMGPASTFGGTWDWRDPSGEPPGHASDRYAAAMCLFWLHAGRHPFDGRAPEPGESADVDAAELEPAALRAFFLTALHPVPADRFRTARAMRDAWLAAVGAPIGGEAPEEGPLSEHTALHETALPPRAVRSLTAAQIRTVGELLALGPERLSQVAGLGDRMIARVRALIDQARRQGLAPSAAATEPEAPPLFRPLAFEPAPLVDLPLDAGLLDALRQAGLRTIGDVAGRTRADLLRVPRVGQAALIRLGQALVQWHDRHAQAGPIDTLDGVWARATARLDDAQRDVLALAFGVHGPPVAASDLGRHLGVDGSTASARKGAALARLDQAALDPVADAVDGYLDQERGVLPLAVVCERLGRDLPTAEVEPGGLVRLLAALDTRNLHLLDGPADVVVARPWFDRDLLTTFTDTVARVVADWPPESVAAARTTLRMVLPDFDGDPLLLAQRLVPDVRVTATGHLFQPPIGAGPAVAWVLDRAREPFEHAALVAEVDRVFAGAGPQVPPLHELPALLAGTGWRVEGTRVVRPTATAAPATQAGDDPRELLALDATVDPNEAIKRLLRGAAARRASFRLVVAPPESRRRIARSLIAALDATPIDLTDAWFQRHEGTLAADARAPRFPALRVATSKRLDALMGELVEVHGRPDQTFVVHETGLLEALGGLEQIRLLYDRVQGQTKGFWVVVIPGLVRARQPLFNERSPVWHMPGLVLPLTEELPAG